MKRLAETKLNNIEEKLEILRKQQEWLRRYNELEIKLRQEKSKLFDLNKLHASMTEDIRQLERFEKFETIQGTYQRMAILEKLVDQNKRNISLLERENEDLRQTWNDQEKLQNLAENQRKNAEKKLNSIHDNIFQALNLQGLNQAYSEEINNLSILTDKAKLQADTLKNNIAKVEQEIEILTEDLSNHKAERQSMEVHEQMISHAEKVLLYLENLQEIEEEQQKIKNLQAKTIREQNEENKILERVFSTYQEITSEIETLEGEIKTHRTNILGQESFKLQEHAMQLKSHKQMLLAAQSLWHQISQGYNIIEEKTKTLNELRLHIEHTQRNIKEMETEVGKLSRLCLEKEHTYFLSKGQDIIQLRADLKEGVSCAVCGATHHPYHSDTMLEQSKLIGEFKTDYEMLTAEVRDKQKLLDDLRIDLAESKGKKFSEESALNSIRLRQNDDIKEWSLYTSLDSSFKDCTASTNLDARMALIRHLIESTATDADKAERELETYNYHVSQITKLTEKAQTLELRKNDLSVRLNEVNTGCQVRAGQVEKVLAMMDKENVKYSEIYHKLEECITIKGWKEIWDNNHENLREQIQKLTSAWNLVNEQIRKKQQELVLCKTQHEALLLQQKSIKYYSELVISRKEKCMTLIEENKKTIRQAVGEMGAVDLYNQTYLQLNNARKAEEDELKKTLKILHEIDYIKGRNNFYNIFGKDLSEKLSEERSRLDIWMHNFNKHNPPVQYTELEKVFGEDKNWEEIRSRVHKTLQDITLCQAHVDNLNSRFLALQTESNYHNIDEKSLQESMATQQESLEEKRREIMMQIARQTVALEEHEKAVHSVNNSAQLQDSASELY